MIQNILNVFKNFYGDLAVKKVFLNKMTIDVERRDMEPVKFIFFQYFSLMLLTRDTLWNNPPSSKNFLSYWK